MRFRFHLIGLLLVMSMFEWVGFAFAENLPTVRVENIRRGFHNGEHNAFTDLCRFQNSLYLTFRTCPDGHMVYSSSSILVLRSDDEGVNWSQVHRFSVPERDTRDPHFLIFRDRLFLYTGTWWAGPGQSPTKDLDVNKHLGFAVWSDDGKKWSAPTMLEGTFGHYIWRAAAHGDKAYLCGRRKAGFSIPPKAQGITIQSVMLESDDGLIWKKCAYFNESSGDETAFFIEADGRLLGIARDGEGKEAHLLRSSPPYSDWSRKRLDRSIGGPLLAKWGDRVLVGGRHTTPDRGPKTSLCWLIDDTLSEFVELPSGGDNSYPGFVELSPTKGLVSWYSSHEKDESGKTITAIYLADLILNPSNP